MSNSNGNENFFPVVFPGYTYGDGSTEPAFAREGITKREYLAGIAMQGMLTNWLEYSKTQDECDNLAKAAVNFADALLDALAQPIPATP